MTEKEKDNQKRSFMGNKKVLLIVLIILIGSITYFLSIERSNDSKNIIPGNVTEPVFVKHGELWFIGNELKDTLKHISIEIADDDQKRAQGLMYRSSMPDTRGMLFIFDSEGEQSFWMKNTIMSLDIIYVNENKEIVTIYKHTQPYSENPIPSFESAMYVVETIAGFCDKYGIEKGDLIQFKRD